MGLHPVEKDFDFSERTFDKQNVQRNLCGYLDFTIKKPRILCLPYSIQAAISLNP